MLFSDYFHRAFRGFPGLQDSFPNSQVIVNLTDTITGLDYSITTEYNGYLLVIVPLDAIENRASEFPYKSSFVINIIDTSIDYDDDDDDQDPENIFVSLRKETFSAVFSEPMEKQNAKNAVLLILKAIHETRAGRSLSSQV